MGDIEASLDLSLGVDAILGGWVLEIVLPPLSMKESIESLSLYPHDSVCSEIREGATMLLTLDVYRGDRL